MLDKICSKRRGLLCPHRTAELMRIATTIVDFKEVPC